LRGAAIAAWGKALAAIAVTVALFPLQIVVRAVSDGPAAFVLPQWWHRALCRVLAIDVELVGTLNCRAGTIYAGNHISHFDVFAVGSCVRAAFIAKGEMSGWPGMKLLGAMQQTLFVSRRARDAARVGASVREAIGRGTRLVLFAEGTISAGTTVAPFRSSLLEVLADPSPPRINSWLQPFTLELTEVDGRPIGSAIDRDLYAFHAATPGTSRKELAQAAHAAVTSALGSVPNGVPPSTAGAR